MQLFALKQTKYFDACHTQDASKADQILICM